MDILTSLVSAGLATAVGALVVKLQKLSPQLKETLEQVDNFRKNATDILGLIENLELLIKSLSDAVNDGELSDDEIKKLLADAQVLLSNPAINDLKKLVEGN